MNEVSPSDHSNSHDQLEASSESPSPHSGNKKFRGLKAFGRRVFGGRKSRSSKRSGNGAAAPSAPVRDEDDDHVFSDDESQHSRYEREGCVVCFVVEMKA